MKNFILVNEKKNEKMGGMKVFSIQYIRKNMELLKYYQIDDIYREKEDNIEIYGKTITGKYFSIKMKNENGELKTHYHEDIKELVIYNKRLKRQMIKIGSDMDFFDKYKKYMDMQTYLFVHTMIMNAINRHNSSK